MRKRLIAGVLTLSLALLAVPAATSADVPLNDHNCAGAGTSAGAGPGFGSLVAFFAKLQLVDNFGAANCGAPPRNNP